ncbi:MAG: hypothetical protein QNK04_10620 [Myxococcota bacterium]|nr:hypothetical protein [Myxococcota bacterium]
MSARNVARIAAGAVLCLALGCVTSMTESELKKHLDQEADQMRLGDRRVMPIYAETRLLAQAMLLEARTDPNSTLSRQIGKRLAAAARRRQSVVVGGPYPKLSDRVLVNAMSAHDEGGLRGLRVVLVSSDRPSAELAQAAREAQARLYHRAER